MRKIGKDKKRERREGTREGKAGNEENRER